MTPVQDQTYLASFDLLADRRSEVADLLRHWSEVSARLCAGETAAPLGSPHRAVSDTGEAIGLSPNRLTITVGFSPSLFVKEGEDRTASVIVAVPPARPGPAAGSDSTYSPNPRPFTNPDN